MTAKLLKERFLEIQQKFANNENLKNFEEDSKEHRLELLEKNNIEARPVWKPMHMQPLYNEFEYINKNNNDISKKIFECGLCLPSGSSLTAKDQKRVIDIIFSILHRQKPGL